VRSFLRRVGWQGLLGIGEKPKVGQGGVIWARGGGCISLSYCEMSIIFVNMVPPSFNLHCTCQCFPIDFTIEGASCQAWCSYRTLREKYLKATTQKQNVYPLLKNLSNVAHSSWSVLDYSCRSSFWNSGQWVGGVFSPFFPLLALHQFSYTLLMFF